MGQEAGPGPTPGDHALMAWGQVSEQWLGKGLTLGSICHPTLLSRLWGAAGLRLP